MAVLQGIMETHANYDGGLGPNDAASGTSPSDWWYFNDDKVSKIVAGPTLEAIKKQYWFGQPDGVSPGKRPSLANAYMLFYDRVIPGGSCNVPPPAAMPHADVSYSEVTRNITTAARMPRSQAPPGGLLVPSAVHKELVASSLSAALVKGAPDASFIDSPVLHRLVAGLARQAAMAGPRAIAPPRHQLGNRRLDTLELCGRILFTSSVVRGSSQGYLSENDMLKELESAISGRCTVAPESSASPEPSLSDDDALGLCERLLRIACFPGTSDAWLRGVHAPAPGATPRVPPMLSRDALTAAVPVFAAAFRHGKKCAEALAVVNRLCDAMVARLSDIALPMLRYVMRDGTQGPHEPCASQASTLTHQSCEYNRATADENEFALDADAWRGLEALCRLPLPVLALRASVALGTPQDDPFQLKVGTQGRESERGPVHDPPSEDACRAVRALDLLFRSFLPVMADLMTIPPVTADTGAKSDSRSLSRAALVEVRGCAPLCCRCPLPCTLTPRLLQLYCRRLVVWQLHGSLVTALLVRNHALEWLLQVGRQRVRHCRASIFHAVRHVHARPPVPDLDTISAAPLRAAGMARGRYGTLMASLASPRVRRRLISAARAQVRRLFRSRAWRGHRQRESTPPSWVLLPRSRTAAASTLPPPMPWASWLPCAPRTFDCRAPSLLPREPLQREYRVPCGVAAWTALLLSPRSTFSGLAFRRQSSLSSVADSCRQSPRQLLAPLCQLLAPPRLLSFCCWTSEFALQRCERPTCAARRCACPLSPAPPYLRTSPSRS